MNGEAYFYIPEDRRGKFPPLHAIENEPNPMIWVKPFTPDSSWTWYVTEFDGQDICFGLVVGHAVELSYISIEEITTVCRPLGLRIEWDLFFEGKSLEEIRSKQETLGR